MRKPALCICENKDTDQLRCYREADQRLCFRYITKVQFVPDQVGNPGDRFSQNEAYIKVSEIILTGSKTLIHVCT